MKYECVVSTESLWVTSPVSYMSERMDLNQRLIRITDRTLDIVFSKFGCNSFIITLSQKPREVLRSRRKTDSLCLVILRQLRETPLGFCLRVIVNEFHPNLEKTISSVLSVLFFNLWKLWTWIYNKYLTTYKRHRGNSIVSHEGS